MAWKPRSWKEELTWLIEIIKTLPYTPSLRWCQYRIMERWGIDKRSFGTLEKSITKARKYGWNGWTPDTLADSVRQVHYRGHDYQSYGDVVEAIIKRAWKSNLWSRLDFYVEVWFEAEAMEGQFSYYLDPFRITTRPFRGDYSVPMKWRAAQDLNLMGENGKKIIILYFGDADKKGDTIPKDALKDIFTWGPNFDYVRGGLDIEQVRRFDLPENPERPGQWQWEGLTDDQAKEIILGNLKDKVDIETLKKEIEVCKSDEEDWKNRLKNALGVVKGKNS